MLLPPVSRLHTGLYKTYLQCHRFWHNILTRISSAMSSPLVLVKLWSPTDCMHLELQNFKRRKRDEKGREKFSVVVEKLCLSRIRDTNMLIIVSLRTAAKHFLCNPLIRHYTSEHARYRRTPTLHTYLFKHRKVKAHLVQWCLKSPWVHKWSSQIWLILMF